MAKNIVICSDGTGNTALKGRGTNVFRIYESVDLHGWKTDSAIARQVAFYDDGVGTDGVKPLRLLGGAFGLGLSRNVKQLYAALARVYQPGDRIYLFGFSRGAFTVRTLAGMIAECGVISLAKCDDREKLSAAVEEAYQLHRRHYQTWVQGFLRSGRRRKAEVAAVPAGEPPMRVQKFHGDCAVAHSREIEFIGVWDTVDAVGLPFEGASAFWNAYIYCYKFPDYTLSPKVKRAAHALAIDDERRSFHPLLWQEHEETTPRIEQTWFAGAHSNVGGGYPKQGMSIVTLDWMMSRAEAAGLCFVASDRDYYREHVNVHDQLYDSRAGLGVYYRYGPRDLQALCRAAGTKVRLHASAVERIALATQDYAPGNIPLDAMVSVTDPQAATVGRLGDWMKTEEQRAACWLTPTRSAIGVRRATHLMPIVVTVLLVSLGFPVTATVGDFFKNLAELATPSGMWALVKTLTLRWYGLPLLLPLALFVISRRARRSMMQRFSQWWHPRRVNLREALELENEGYGHSHEDHRVVRQ